MDRKAYAVVTGDIVRSSSIESNFNEALEEIAGEIRQHKAPGFLLEIYRGDSFQGLLEAPELAMSVGILIRAGLRRHSRQSGRGLDDIWDARISIGVGTLKGYTPGATNRIGSLEGEAFQHSGKALDSMKGAKNRLVVTTGKQQLDHEFAAGCAMADVIIGRWSNEQSEAVYLHLLQGLTQEEIGHRLDISQRAAGKRLTASHVDSIEVFIRRYEEVIAWNYSN